MTSSVTEAGEKESGKTNKGRFNSKVEVNVEIWTK